tara:strand:+ start:569 stop:2287 length:1719 start_codon:yes stop_codon:yes gene_type:complete
MGTDTGTGNDADISVETLTLERLFPTNDNPGKSYAGCMFASPILYDDGSGPLLLIFEGGGTIAGLDLETGDEVWSFLVPAPTGEDPFGLATPLILDDLMVLTYHTTPTPEGEEPGSNSHTVMDHRIRHRVVVVDLITRDLHPDFPLIDLATSVPDSAGTGMVEFQARYALGRSAIVHGKEEGDDLGRAYITFGNGRDIQPWHGWAFEIDLDAWRAGGSEAAVSATFCTTPESDCGQTNVSGSKSRLCGGGLWAPSGPLVIQDEANYSLLLAPGNGQLDLNRQDYANTLIKTGPGLDFDPGCDPDLCSDFDPDAPSLSCIQSCSNLFIPRLLPGQSRPDPADGRCEGMTLFECWGLLDFIGGSTPVYIALQNGINVLAYPTKDGHIYLVDADHLGTMYDRHKMVEQCGVPGDQCIWYWAGMSVTQPTLTNVGDEPVVLVPTFMGDNTHPAGIVGLRIVIENDTPRFAPFWTYPDFATSEAVDRFRRHPSRLQLHSHGASETEVGWVVETARPGKKATLHAIRVSDGKKLVSAKMKGPGFRYTMPLIHDDVVYLNTCGNDSGPSYIEAYRISAP